MAEATSGDENADKKKQTSKNMTSPRQDNKDFGIDAIDRALNNIYPDHDNPSSILSSPVSEIKCEANVPLDFIKVFLNTGKNDYGASPHSHWHYITYGFSDLHGDGRVHDGRGQPSGYGFELTFRLKKAEDEKNPPYWPVMLLNNLSLYVFNTDTALSAFDHIPWYDSLDEVTKYKPTNPDIIPCPSNSAINHMIIVQEPQIPDLDTPNGTVHFLQVVGVLSEEFRYARSWKACGIIGELLKHPQVGPLMLTDMRRKVSVFDLNPRLVVDILKRIDSEGSVLGRVITHISWKEIKEEDDTGLAKDVENLKIDDTHEYCNMECVHLEFDASAGELLPLMVKGRLRHRQNFVFVSPGCAEHQAVMTIEFVPHNSVDRSLQFVDDNIPLRANLKTNHLQILCSEAFIDKLEVNFTGLERLREQMDSLPMQIMVRTKKMKIIFTIYHILKYKKSC